MAEEDEAPERNHKLHFKNDLKPSVHSKLLLQHHTNSIFPVVRAVEKVKPDETDIYETSGYTSDSSEDLYLGHRSEELEECFRQVGEAIDGGCFPWYMYGVSSPLYCRDAGESDVKGFDVGHFPSYKYGEVIPLSHSDLIKNEYRLHSKLALQHYNYFNDTNFEFVGLYIAHLIMCAGYRNNITFLAHDVRDGTIERFAASTWVRPMVCTGYLSRVKVLSCELKSSELSKGVPCIFPKLVKEDVEDKGFLGCEHALAVFKSESFKDLFKVKGFNPNNLDEPSYKFAPIHETRFRSWLQPYIELALDYVMSDIIKKQASRVPRPLYQQGFYEWFQIEWATIQTENDEFSKMEPRRCNFYIVLHAMTLNDDSPFTIEVLVRRRFNAHGELCIQMKCGVMKDDH